MINITHPNGFRTVIPQSQIKQLGTEPPTSADPPGTIGRLVVLQEVATGQMLQTVLHFRDPAALGRMHAAVDAWAERAEPAYLSVQTSPDPVPVSVNPEEESQTPEDPAGPKLSIDIT